MSKPATVTGRVLGYREWFFHEGELLPINADNSWQRSFARLIQDFRYGYGGPVPPLVNRGPGLGPWQLGVPNEASCRHGNHHAPQRKCGCGLYALNAPPEKRAGPKYVVGALVGWGRTIAHESGFRSEFAEIVALAIEDEMSHGMVKELRALAGPHNIAVCERADLEAVAAEHGAPLPENLRPSPQYVAAWQRREDMLMQAAHMKALADMTAAHRSYLSPTRAFSFPGEPTAPGSQPRPRGHFKRRITLRSLAVGLGCGAATYAVEVIGLGMHP